MFCSKTHDCAVLISSCDSYSDIWDPFFTLFKRYWSDNPYPVYVNSETLDCCNDKVSVTTLKARSAGMSWTARLREALERIDSEYIVFFLDDFFLYDNVDTKRVEECLSYMRNDADIAAIYFTCLRSQMKMEECDLKGLERCGHLSRSKLNLTLALWKKDAFEYYLSCDESAWEFEANAFERSYTRNDTFYSFSKNEPLAVPYDFTKYGLFAGKWFKPTADLFKKNGIIQDFSARGLHEEYEYGLVPYVANKIEMDSYLVPCYSLTRDNPQINVKAEDVVNEGAFTQKYDVTGAKNSAIWYPSSISGFAIENFKCTIVFASGRKKILRAKDVYGGFSLHDGIMYFLGRGVFVYIFTKSKDVMRSITIEGCMNKHMSREKLAYAYGLNVRVAPTRFNDLLNGSRLYAETLLVPKSFMNFRIYSRLSFLRNGKYDTKKAILDGKDRLPGSFSQSYKIDKAAGNTVRWDIGGTFGGYAIQNLRVELIYGKGVSQSLKPQNIKSDATLIDDCWVFMSTPDYMLFLLPKQKPDKIRISGTVLAPMPSKLLRIRLFGRDVEKKRKSFFNFNGLRFIIALIKKGIKKYGVFGVVIEVIKRIFHCK